MEVDRDASRYSKHPLFWEKCNVVLENLSQRALVSSAWHKGFVLHCRRPQTHPGCWQRLQTRKPEDVGDTVRRRWSLCENHFKSKLALSHIFTKLASQVGNTLPRLNNLTVAPQWLTWMQCMLNSTTKVFINCWFELLPLDILTSKHYSNAAFNAQIIHQQLPP